MLFKGLDKGGANGVPGLLGKRAGQLLAHMPQG